MPTVVYLAVLFSALALAISIFSFFFFRHYLRRRTGQERILSELREEVDKIVRSIDETTERDISLIEERGKALRGLLDEVDKRLKLYIRELEKHREAEDTHAALISKTQAPSYQELGKKRYRLNEQSIPETSAVPAESLPAAEETVSVPAPPPSVGERIRELVRAGLTPSVIASRLGLSIAEVEFATALMERRDAQLPP